jgi:hypothetical protein
MRFWVVPLLCVGGLFLVTSCSNDLHVTVLANQMAGLKPDDPVHWRDQQIGTVTAVQVTPEGRVAVRLRIVREFRQQVTDACRFLISSNPNRPGAQAVNLVCLKDGGTPLAAGQEVEASTPLTLLMEQGRRGLQAWSERLKDEMARWSKTLEQLPDTAEWDTHLERLMDYWTRELQQAGAEMRRYFHQEVLPTLEQALKELQQRLEEQGRGHEARPLERKLEELKRL